MIIFLLIGGYCGGAGEEEGHQSVGLFVICLLFSVFYLIRLPLLGQLR